MTLWETMKNRFNLQNLLLHDEFEDKCSIPSPGVNVVRVIRAWASNNDSRLKETIHSVAWTDEE